ncbi:MAG TPA: copper oxidase [Deltaproteobacteria bacterium]|nr:copper oxidase [Deltaproteobacteria bacterium]
MQRKIFYLISVFLCASILLISCSDREKPPSHSQAETKASASSDKTPSALPYTPVITPNGSTLAWEMVDGVKEFHLSVEEIDWEIAPGMKIKAWGYNGQTPGPTIEAVEGDRVRILVTNRLPEATAVHWHGFLLPSGMDGVKGLNQKGIKPGETFAYEFTLKQHGTQMYHSHGDEMTQIGLGAMGFFIVHPKEAPQKIDRDYAIFLNEWFVPPGSKRPNPVIMTDFNIFTFNSRAFPGTAPLMAQSGERVRIRFGNVGQESHPIHLHGHHFKVVATDGGDIPESAQYPETTVLVAPGQTRDIELIANPGDWALHCHRRHHPMNAMGHEFPNLIGVNQDKIEGKITGLLPGYMAMGERGMDEHQMHARHMPGPENTLPMMTGVGPFGNIGMGGMFTVLKVRDRLKPGDENGWFENPPGTVSEAISPPPQHPH